jgi:tetratricopeptide (TPR) repeat protein
VRDEAAEGRDQGKLVPATIDGVKPPLGFRQYQTIDLSKRRSGVQPLHELVRVVGNMGKGQDGAAEQHSYQATSNDHWTLQGKWPLLAAVALALIAAAAFLASRIIDRSSVPIVAVMAVDRSAAGEAVARNLLVKLGSLRSAKTDSVRLISGAGGEAPNADFVFQAAASNDHDSSQGNLVLLAGNDRSILWSKDFEVQGGSRTALEQSMAYTAGHILDCALEASEGSQERINQDTLKLFLNGCALFADKYRADPQGVGPIFERIIERSPRFQPAWRKLLLSEALFTRTERLLGRHTPGELPRHIAKARKLNPQIPEIYVAESTLLPTTAYARRSDLLEQAVRLDPDNPDLLLMRAEFNLFVGRLAEVIDDATRAVELNPLSPGLRSHLIADLAYAGRIESAQEELRRAEQLWPGSVALEDARFRLNLRYGDPRVALRMLKSGPVGRQPMASPTIEAVLAARIDPTDVHVRRAIAAAQSRASSDTRSLGDLLQMMGEFHREDELYELVLNWRRTDLLGAIGEVLFRPPLARFRQDPRFMQVAARVHLIDYWRRSGEWPDFCFDPDLPYDCKKEAAKLGA